MLGWLRASLATGEYDPEDPQPIIGPILKALSPDLMQPGELSRSILSQYGWGIQHVMAEGDPKVPYLTIHRSENALILSGYQKNEHSSQIVRTPMGAPLLVGYHNRIERGATRLDGQIAWQAEVRVLANSNLDETVLCRELVPAMHGVHRRILISGMKSCSLTILPDPKYLDTLRLLPDPAFPYFLGTPLETKVETAEGHTVVITPELDGELLIEW